MTDDLSAVPVSGPHPGSDELGELASSRQRTVDDHMFTVPGLPGTCRLQLFTADGCRPVAVATQIAGDEGLGLTNGVEQFAGAVWERHCPDQKVPPVWVQRQLAPEGSPREARFQRVAFAGADGYRPTGPRWRGITDEQLRVLVGGEVDPGRGVGYVPRPAVPEPRLVFREFAVVRLGRPHPFRERGCMPKGVPWWRRWLRQALPRRDVRSCCWYHGGDWHAVNALALEVLRRARAQGVVADDMEDFAAAQAAEAGASMWQTEALSTLFDPTVAIQPDSEGGYINGQHRAQAMLEAGVRRTVVLEHVYDA
ncbi:hypothetical protein ACTWJ8_40485 (plasmid) [Streptomyces sp. SDT5-1]|uniref:hypothetical protein n=1 Tax=Streptomyces sp. SDT5-1 TaxID=3406418 RepID=UPI003FD021CD